MKGRIWLLSGVLATLLGSTGCISTGYEGVKIAQGAGPSCDLPLTTRNEVYVFVLGGNNPVEMMAIDKFREGLNAGGFTKIASGPSTYCLWMASEMARIHREDPSAVFVIAGLDSAASIGMKLSEKAQAQGIPVQGIILVDATSKLAPPTASVHTLLVGTSFAIESNPNVESLVITSPGRYGLPAEIRTIDSSVRMLNDIAAANPVPVKSQADAQWSYVFSPDLLVSTERKDDSEWSFMFDKPGCTTRAMDEPLLPKTSSVGNTNTATK